MMRTHRVVEIRTPHLVFNVDRDQVLVSAVASERQLAAGRVTGRWS